MLVPEPHINAKLPTVNVAPSDSEASLYSIYIGHDEQKISGLNAVEKLFMVAKHKKYPWPR